MKPMISLARNRLLNNLDGLILDFIVILTPLLVTFTAVRFLGGDPGVNFILLSMFGLLIVPGFLFFRLFFEKEEPLFVILSSFAFSLFLGLYPALATYFFKLHIEFFLGSILVFSLVFLLLNILVRKEQVVDTKKIDVFQVFLAILSLIYLSVAVMRGAHQAGDAVFHIGYIRFLVDNVPVSPYEAHFPVEAINPSSGYSLWYMFLASISKISNQAVYVVWRSSIYLLSVLLPLGLYYFTKAITKSKNAAFWTVIFSAIYFFEVGQLTDTVTADYPDRIARLLLTPVAIVLIQRLLTKKEKYKANWLHIALIGALSAAAFSIHMYSWFFIFVLLFIFFVIDFFKNKERGKKTFILYAKIIGVTSVLTLPALLLKIKAIVDYSAFVTEAGLLGKGMISVGNGLIMVDPKHFDILVATSTVLLLVYGAVNFKKKKPYWYWYSWLVILIPAFIMYFPPITTLAAKIVSPVYVRRMMLFVPFFLIVGASFDRLLNNKTAQILGLAAILATVSTTKPVVNFKVSEATKIEPVYAYIRENIPQKSTIFSNLWDSFYVSAFSNNYIVATFKQHMTSNINKMDRIKSVALVFYSQRDNIQKIDKIVKKYGVDYMLVRKNLPPKKSYTRYFKASTASFDPTNVTALTKLSEYKKIYEDNDFVLYKVR